MLQVIKRLAFSLREALRRWNQLDREAVAALYLRGEGIEIGALHSPLRVPGAARVRYLDRVPAAELRKLYPELRGANIPDTDIVDDGEKLAAVAEASQDFLIANHFLEHCENPLATMANFARVLKNGGIVFLALPDKRDTFDSARPVTPLDHVLKDYREGPEWSRKAHLEEWARLVERTGDSALAGRVAELLKTGYSIHYHVWDHQAMLQLLGAIQQMFPLELELFARNRSEWIVILRKSSAL